MIDVIVSALNCEKFLEKCLESIVKQSIKCNIILVNPKPSKTYKEIRNKYKNFIKKEINTPDKGCANGLNNALKYATCEYIAVLNGDDFFLQNSLIKIKKQFLQKPDVLIGNGLIVNEKSILIKDLISQKVFSGFMWAGSASICHQATFIRKKIFDSGIKFNIQNNICWDSELLLDIFLKKKYKFSYTQEKIGVFRLHKNSISSSENIKPRIEAEIKKIFHKIYGRYPNIYEIFYYNILRRLLYLKKIPHLFMRIFLVKKKII